MRNLEDVGISCNSYDKIIYEALNILCNAVEAGDNEAIRKENLKNIKSSYKEIKRQFSLLDENLISLNRCMQETKFRDSQEIYNMAKSYLENLKIRLTCCDDKFHKTLFGSDSEKYSHLVQLRSLFIQGKIPKENTLGFLALCKVVLTCGNRYVFDSNDEYYRVKEFVEQNSLSIDDIDYMEAYFKRAGFDAFNRDALTSDVSDVYYEE